MKTGNTSSATATMRVTCPPQWSPVMKTGNTGMWRRMPALMLGPQWSPVMKTGNTGHSVRGGLHQVSASMEPGHEDREYTTITSSSPKPPTGLNGARS